MITGKTSLRHLLSTARKLASGDAIEASAATEFGMIASVLMLMFIGAIDLGAGFYRYLQVESAAGAGARYAALNDFNSSTIASAILNATANSGISASPAPSQFCGCPTSSGISTVSCGSTCTGGGTAGTYATASAQANYSPIISYPLLPKTFIFSAKATIRTQ
jgi:Flp pilus assembly protein TadG